MPAAETGSPEAPITGTTADRVTEEPPPAATDPSAEVGKDTLPGPSAEVGKDTLPDPSRAVQASAPKGEPPVKKDAVEAQVPEENAQDYLSIGAEFLSRKQYPEAIVELGKAAEADPSSGSVREKLFEAHFQEGLVQFGKEEYLQARNHFEIALRYNKNCDKCLDYVGKCSDTYMEKHYNLGMQYFGREQLDEAIREWRLVEAVNPDYKDLAASLKKALLLNERLEKIKKGQAQ
jgi:tetratricopeptide (TPR) repeat protein